MRSKQRQHGWLMIEVLVTMWVLLTLIGALAAVMYASGKANRALWTRQQAAAAVRAQLDCLSQTGDLLPDEEFTRLWPGFAATLTAADGTGPTQGLTHVELTVTGHSGRKSFSLSGRRYIPQGGTDAQ